MVESVAFQFPEVAFNSTIFDGGIMTEEEPEEFVTLQTCAIQEGLQFGDLTISPKIEIS
jgi:hypothetical protein